MGRRRLPFESARTLDLDEFIKFLFFIGGKISECSGDGGLVVMMDDDSGIETMKGLLCERFGGLPMHVHLVLNDDKFDTMSCRRWLKQFVKGSEVCGSYTVLHRKADCTAKLVNSPSFELCGVGSSDDDVVDGG